MFKRDLGLTDLVALSELQHIQDYFSDVLEITLIILSPEGKPISKASRMSRFCGEILPKLPASKDFCANCILNRPSLDFSMGEIKKETNFKCPFGLDLFVIPVKAVGERTVAYIVAGPVILKARKSVSEYIKDAEKLGIAVDELMDTLIEINVFSYSKVSGILNLLSAVFSRMAQSEYHKKRLGEIVPEVVALDPLFSRYYEEKILATLLNAATLALGADSGSVMTVDKKTNMLHIKVSSKLDEDIVHDTNIKVGEEIAGLAAATSKPIILPKDEGKDGLSKKMKRRYIKSSMIVPFNKGIGHDVYGVINLNIVRRNAAFSEKDIDIVKELVNMASIALIPLHQPAV